MIPKFTSQTDMIGFLRALPQNANYRKMLKDDFKMDCPEDAPRYQAEYMWKYMVQGSTKGLQGDSLVNYAVDGVKKFETDPLLTHRVTADMAAPVGNVVKNVSVRVQRSAKVSNVVDGLIVFNEKYQKYDGYANGKVVSRAGTVAKVQECLGKKYNVTQFDVKEK